METKRPPAIKIERVLRGLSQEALGRSAGISQPFLSLLENGQRTPSAKTAEALARALGCPPGRIFENVDEGSKR